MPTSATSFDRLRLNRSKLRTLLSAGTSMTNLLSDLNPIQQEAVKAIEGPCLILAGAGSGKTRVLTYRVAYLISEKGIPAENILAITFTNKASNEMKERILKLIARQQVQGKSAKHSIPTMGTFHSLCARILRKDGYHLGLSPNFSIYDEGDSIDAVKEAMKNLDLASQKTSPASVKNTISQAKNEMISSMEYPQYARGFYQEMVAKIYLEYQKILEKNQALDFDDLLLLTVRLFQNHPEVLNKYQMQFRYILVDEYQDTNAVQYLLSKLLAKRHQNICVVGDASQCLLPGTKVATSEKDKNVQDITVGEKVIAAAGRGLTHQAPVTKVKVSNYSGKVYVIETGSGKILKLTPNHILFARLNLSSTRYYVYLMYRNDKGYRIGIAKSARIAKGGETSVGLQVRSNQESADKMWILKVCSNRADANFWEQYFIVEYGIPSMVFSTGGRSMLISQNQIDQLYKTINTVERAKKLFSDFHLFQEYPHHRPKGIASRLAPDRQLVHLTLFGDKRPSLSSPWCGHRISINTSNRTLEQNLVEAGYYTRAGKKDTWRIETCYWNYTKAVDLAESISKDGGNLVIDRAAFLVDNKKFSFMPASHLRETMEIGILVDDKILVDEIISAKTENYQGKVYDIDVDILHNYSANGVIVHNSIYSFRGADYRNIVNFKVDYPNASVFNLEQNYRSTQNILDAAYCVIAKNRTHPILKLWTQNPPGQKIQINYLKNETEEALFLVKQINGLGLSLSHYAVLYRTNAQSRALEEVFLKAGLPYVLVGGTRFYERKEIKDILAYLRLFSNREDSVSKARVEKIGKGRTNKFFGLVDKLSTETPNLTTLELLDQTLEVTGYLDYLDDGTDTGKTRVENVKELRSVAEQFPNLTSFLENVTLVESEYTSDEKLKKNTSEKVTLTTLHQAKGLEWPVVFMVGMEEGLFPHSRCLLDCGEMEEERRLCYVGITRAKQVLFLTYTRQRLFFGTRSNNLVSRFIMDIPEHLIESNVNYQDLSEDSNSIFKQRDDDPWLND